MCTKDWAGQGLEQLTLLIDLDNAPPSPVQRGIEVLVGRAISVNPRPLEAHVARDAIWVVRIIAYRVVYIERWCRGRLIQEALLPDRLLLGSDAYRWKDLSPELFGRWPFSGKARRKR